MHTLTAAEILGTPDLSPVYVEVPEWNGAVFVKHMTGEERDAFDVAQVARIKRKNPDAPPTQEELFEAAKNATALLVAATACDEDGNLLFDETDVAALGRKSAGALKRVAAVATRINGLGPQAVEQAAKN